MSKTSSVEGAPAVAVQRVVSCAMTDKDGTCREPATVEIYAIPNQMWYPLCDKHRVNIIAPIRKISQPNGAANSVISEPGAKTKNANALDKTT